MIAISKSPPTTSAEALHRQFVDRILPVVELHARIRLRYVSGQDYDDAVQEAQAVAWQLFIQAIAGGKDPTGFPTYIAAFAVRRVRSERLLAGPNTRDVLSPVTQQRNGFEVHSLDDESCDEATGWKAAASVDTRRWPVPDVVAFRVDFERWLNGLSHRVRSITERLTVGDRTGEVARQFRVSPSRISQLRKELQQSWDEFQGESAVDDNAAAA